VEPGRVAEGDPIDFAVSATRDGDVADVVVAGEVDSATGERLTQAVDAELAAGATAIRLDLAQTSFVDSSGLVVLLDVRAATAARSASLVLVRPSRAVRRVLEMTELTSIFDVET
jgi:anti-sigma B factor antagonist